MNMAKDESTTQTDHEELAVRAPHTRDGYMSRHKPDTRIVVIAVGASVVLFVVGLILGFLLGHQTAESRGGLNSTMMNGNSRNYLYRTQ